MSCFIFASHESPLQQQHSPFAAWFFASCFIFASHESPQQQLAFSEWFFMSLMSHESSSQHDIAQHESACFF
jgi:hypothetical protein